MDFDFEADGSHLFGGLSGLWVEAHFDWEQWAQKLRERKNEIQS